jgi:hypothetical protein
MNLIDGRSDGTAFSASGWLRILCAHRGEVTLGVRPEDVALRPTNEFVAVGEGETTESRQVDSRMLVTVRGAQASEIRGFANELPKGRVTIYLRSNRLHWFDVQTGERFTT